MVSLSPQITDKLGLQRDIFGKEREASELHFKGGTVGVRRGGSFEKRLPRSPGTAHLPFSSAKAPLVLERVHILERCNFIIFLWFMARLREGVAACEVFIYDVVFRMQCLQILARLNL